MHYNFGVHQSGRAAFKVNFPARSNVKELPFDIFPWQNNFATGIVRIDDQHKKLVDMLNSLASHLVKKRGIFDLKRLLNDLSEYALYHFQTEEEIWHQYFEDDEWEITHRNSHEQFVIELNKFKVEESNTPSYHVYKDELLFLRHWLTIHILDSDMRLSKVVLSVQSGMSLSQAKQQSNPRLSIETNRLIETVLSMYDSTSARTLQLMEEIMEHQKLDADQKKVSNTQYNPEKTFYLTPREVEVMILIVAGNTNKEIGDKIGISYRTVESYRANIMRKTGATNLINLFQISENLNKSS